MAEKLECELPMDLQVENLAVVIKRADCLFDDANAHAHLVPGAPVGVFFGNGQRFIDGTQSLHVDLDGDDKIIDHIPGEFRITAAPDGIETSADADQPVKYALPFFQSFFIAPA